MYIEALFYSLQGQIQDFTYGGRGSIWGGHGPPMWALFGENGCENEKNWVHWKILYVDPPTPCDRILHSSNQGFK